MKAEDRWNAVAVRPMQVRTGAHEVTRFKIRLG
jgi:hypothetical protein